MHFLCFSSKIEASERAAIASLCLEVPMTRKIFQRLVHRSFDTLDLKEAEALHDELHC